MASDYVKIYHNNGRHEKIGQARSFREARDMAAPALAKLSAPLPGDESIEVQVWQGKTHTTIRSRDWAEIARKFGDCDASTHIVFVFAMTAWVAAMMTILPLIGGF